MLECQKAKQKIIEKIAKLKIPVIYINKKGRLYPWLSQLRSKNMITIGKYKFDGPWQLEKVDLLDRACVYAVLCKEREEYGIVYIGETGEIGTRLSGHERSGCWKRNCGNSLYVAIYWTPSDQYSPEKRREIEKELIDRYDPSCNRQ